MFREPFERDETHKIEMEKKRCGDLFGGWDWA